VRLEAVRLGDSEADQAMKRSIDEFQGLIEDIYFERDQGRGVDRTLLWFVEEVGELVRAIRRREPENLEEEFGDVFAWLVSLASIHGLRMDEVAFAKYGEGCPRCKSTPCACPAAK